MPIIPGNYAHLSQQPVKEPDYLDKYSEPVNDVSAPEALPEPDYLDKYSEPVTNELGVVEGQVRGITRGTTRMIAGAHGMIAAEMAPEPLSEDEIKSRVKKWTPPLPQLKSLNLPQTREEYESYLRSLSKGDSEYQRQLSMSNAESNLANDPSLAPSASVTSGTLSDKVKNWRWFSENLAELLPQVVASAGAGVATGGTSPALQVGAYAAVAALPEAGQAFTESINRGSSPDVAKAEAALIGVGNAALEAIPGSELLLRTPASRKMFSKLVQSKAGDLLTSTVAVGAGEGVTELGQEFLADTVRYVMENDPSAYHDWKSRYPMAAILGASMGTGMGATGRAVGATIGDNPLGQPAPPDELIAKAPAVAEFLAGRMSENGKVSRTEWAKAAADAKEAGVHLPYYKRAENATEYATGVVEAMQAKKLPSSEAIPGIEIPPVNVELPPQKDSIPPQSPAVPAVPPETPEVPPVAPGTPDQSPDAGKMVEPGPVASFQTESGSTYTINGQSTTRDKAERLAHGDDKGLKEPSTRTVYVDSATATAIGDAFLTKGHPKPPTLTATESDGVKTIDVTRFTGKTGKKKNIHTGEYFDQPAVGLHPIEIWTDEAGKLKSVHPGSKIVSVVPASQPPAVETNQPIAETPTNVPETAAAPVVTGDRKMVPAFTPLVTSDLPKPIRQDRDGNDVRMLDGIETTFAMGIDAKDGVRYELHRPAKDGVDEGVFRTVDIDSGKTVSVKKYKTWNDAVEAYGKATAIANNESTFFKPGKPSLDNGNTIDVGVNKPELTAEKPKKKPKAGLTKPKAEPETMVTTPRGTKIIAPPSDPAARDEWLVQNARVVAAANGDSEISDLVRDLDPKEMTPEVRAELNKYLTGEEAKPLAPAEDASKTIPVASEVPTQTPVSKESDHGQSQAEAEAQGETHGRQEGLLAKKVEPATESSAPASTKLSPGHDETYREHLPILEKQVGNETAPNRQLAAAHDVARGLPPAVRQALYDHLKTIAPEAYRFGLERGRFVSSESAEFDKKLYAQLKYVNDKANGRGPKNAKEPEQVADLDALGYTTKNVKFVTKLTDDGHRRMVSIKNDIDKAIRDMTDAESKASAEKRDADREAEKPGLTKPIVTSPTNMVNVPSKQVPIAGLESAVADAEAVRQVWGPIERDLSVDYKPEFVDQYKPVILRSIPKIVAYEIDQLRESGMTLEEMRDAIKDIANEVDIDLPFPDTTDYLPDPITGRPPAMKIMEGMDDRRIEVVRDYLNKQLEAEFEKKLPDIEAELKKRKDEDEREQAKAITEDTVDYLDISTDPYSPDDIAELDRQFEEKAKKHGYDFENLKEAWKQWKAENLTTQTADEAKTIDDVVAESVTDTKVAEEKPTTEFKRSTPDRVAGKEEREFWRNEIQNLYNAMEPLRVRLGQLNVEMNGLRSNATKMRAKVQEKMNPIEAELKRMRSEENQFTSKMNEALIEDQIEDAKTEPERLRGMWELQKHRAHSLPRDRWGNAIDEAQYKKLMGDADKHYAKLQDAVRELVNQDDGLDKAEVNEAVFRTLSKWHRQPLEQAVKDAIAPVREDRVANAASNINNFTSLSQDRKQAYLDEIAQTSKSGKDWKSIQDEIIKRATEENQATDSADRVERAAAAKISEQDAAKAADENLIATRREAVAKLAEERFWPENRKRGTKFKSEKGEFFPALNEVDKKTQKRDKSETAVKGDVIGKWIIHESRDNKEGEKKTYTLSHIPTGLSAVHATSAAAIKEVFALADTLGIDMQAIKDDGTMPPGQSKIMSEVIKAVTNHSLDYLSDEGREKALAEVKIAPHNVNADIVLNSFDLGKHGGTGLSTKGLRLIEGENIKSDGTTVQSDGIAFANPTFRADPVFVVNDDGKLTYKVGAATYVLDPRNFNLANSEVKPGDRVGINLADIGIAPLTPAEAVAETLKLNGFTSIKVKGDTVEAAWKDTKAFITGENNQWKADGGKGGSEAMAQADAVLKQIGWLKGNGPVRVIGQDYEAPKGQDRGMFFIPDQEVEYKKNLKPLMAIVKSGEPDPDRAKAISAFFKERNMSAGGSVGDALLEKVAKEDPDLIRLMGLKSSWKELDLDYSLHSAAERLAGKMPELNPGQLVAYHQKAYDEAVPKLNDAVTGKASVDAKANAAIEVLTGKETPVVEALANHLADTNEEVFELARNLAKDPGVYGPMGRISLERVMSKRGQPNISKAASRASRDVPVFHYEASTENSNPSKENPAKGPKIASKVVRDAIKNDYSEDKTITSKPPTTKYGKKLMADLKADHKRKSGYKVGLRSIVDFLADRMHVPIRVGNTQLDSPAHYQSGGASTEGSWFMHLIRSKEGYSQVNHHELGHALSAMVRNVSPSLLKRLDEKLVKLTYMHRSLASANTAEEGFAEFVRRMIVTPLSIPKSFKAAIKEALDQVDTKYMQEIEDAHRAYTYHRNRDPMEQLTANNNDRGKGPKFAANFREAIYNFLFNVVGKGVIVRKIEKEVQTSISSGDTGLDKAQAIDPTGIIGTLRELVSPSYRKKLDDSRKFMASLQNTNADIDAARQSMDVDAPGEVSFMIHGIANGREGVRFRNDIPSPRITKSGRTKKVDPDNSPVSVVNGKPVSVGNLTPKQLKALGEAGFVIPEAVGQGEHLYLSDKSLDKIRSEVGADHWEQFANYGQFRAIHSRWETAAAKGKRYEYPFRLDGFGPNKMKQFLRDCEAAHPEWKKSFKDVEGIFSALLMSSVISGEFSVADAIKIRTAYPDYWPLEVIKEGQTPTSRGMVNGHPTSKIRRSIGSPLEKLPIEIQVASRIKRHVDAYYHSRFTATMARFVGKAASRKASSFGARAAASNMLVPLKMDTKLGEVVSEQEERDMIVDALHRQMLMSVDIDPSLSTNLSGKKLKQYVEAAGLEPVDPELVIVSTPHRKLWRKSEPNAIYVTSSFKNGKRQYWQVGDSLLYKLFAGHGAAGVGKGLDMAGYYIALALGGPQKAFSRAITRTLRFALGNVGLRDILASMMNGKGWRSMIPGFYSMLAITRRIESKIPWIAKLTGNDQLSMDEVRSESQILARQLKAQRGNVHDTLSQRFLEDAKDMLAEGVWIEDFSKMNWKTQLAHVPGIAASSLTKIVDIGNYATGGRYLSAEGEAITREGGFWDSIMQGDTNERASMNYAKLTGNFGQRPGSPNFALLVGTASFLNASIQSSYQFYDNFTDPDPKNRLIAAMKIVPISIMAASAAALSHLLMALVYGDDPEELEKKRNQLRERTDEERTRAVSIGGIFRMPFGPGLPNAIFAYVYNRIEGAIINDPVDPSLAASKVLDSITDLPYGSELIQPQVKALLEIYMNKSFFYKRKIIPSWIERNFPDNPELREYTSTPEFYKSAGRLTGMSPLNIQHFVRNGLSAELDYYIGLADKITDGDPVKFTDMPPLGRMMFRDPVGLQSASVDTISGLDDEYQQVTARLKDMLKRDPQNEQVKVLYAKAQELAAPHQMMKQIDKMYRAAKTLKSQKKFDESRAVEQRMTDAAAEFLKRLKEVREAKKADLLK